MLPCRNKVGYSRSPFLSPSCLPGLAVFVRSHGKLKWGPLVQKLLGILRWRQENSKSSVGPFEHGALCDFPGHIPNCPEWKLHVLWSSNLGRDMDVICAIIMEERPFSSPLVDMELWAGRSPASPTLPACELCVRNKQTSLYFTVTFLTIFKMTKQDGKEGCVWIPFSFSCCRRICTSPASTELTFGTWPYW